MSEGHATARAILIWVAYAATGVMVTSKPELLPRATSGSMVLPQLGSVLISTAHVITVAVRIMHVQTQEPR